MTPQTQKKEGGAFTAISTLFGKKTSPSANVAASDRIPAPDSTAKKERAAQDVPAVSQDNEMTYSEDRASEMLWIRFEDLTALRKGLLTAGKDYVRTGGIVRVTASGLDRLRQIVEEGTTLVVLAGHVVNPNLVLARLPGKEEIQRVRVASAQEWCKGMVMTGCVPSEGKWSCTVRPRFKGRA
jgi:hypothetical protein